MSGGRHREAPYLDRERPFAHRDSWADPLQDLLAAAQITVRVPPSTPLYTCLLYGTLGVAVELDRDTDEIHFGTHA